jgi:NAD(P)H-nitrite reductase large subunit
VREVGDLVRQVHEEHGIAFHLGNTAASFDPNRVTLKTGEQLDADFVVVGIGVRPQTALAEETGIAIWRTIAMMRQLPEGLPN